MNRVRTACVATVLIFAATACDNAQTADDGGDGADAGGPVVEDGGRGAGGGSDAGTPLDAGAKPDGGPDAGATDGGSTIDADAGTDAGPIGDDAGSDAGTGMNDAGADAGTIMNDAGSDAGTVVSDAGSDAGTIMNDAGSDAGTIVNDAGADAGFDAGALADAGMDAGPADSGVLLAGDTCGAATTLVGATSGTTIGFASDYNGGAIGSGCGSVSTADDAGAPDRVYAVSVPTNKRLDVTLTPTGFDATLSLVNDLSACVGAGALVCVGGSNTSGVELASYSNTTGVTETLFVLVDGVLETSAGAFTLSTVLTDLPLTTSPGDTCATATNIAGAAVIQSTTAGLTNDYTSQPAPCSSAAGIDGVYSVDVPAGKKLIASVSGTSTFDPSITLGLVAACTNSTRVCLAGDDSGNASTANSAGFANPTGPTQPVLIFIDSSSSNASGPFQLTTALLDIPAGDTCASAVAITTSGTLSSSIALGLSNDYTSAGLGCGSVGGLDKVFRIDVAPNERLTATVVGTSTSFNPSIALGFETAACTNTARACLASADAAATTNDTVRYSNYNATTQTILIFIDSSSSATGDFQLTTALDAAPSLQAGETCFNATAVTVAGTLPTLVTGATTVGFVNDYSGGTGCAVSGATSATAGLDRVYSVSVPPGQRLTAVATPQPSFNPVLEFVVGPPENCEARPRRCAVSASAAGSGGTETGRYTNPTTLAQTVFVIVDSTTSSVAAQSGSFDLSLTLDTPPPPQPGETCAAAELLPPSPVLGTISGFVTNAASSATCAGTGPDHVYTVTLNAGQTLAMTLTPTTNWDAVLTFVVGAGANPDIACHAAPLVCSVSANLGNAGAIETGSYTNSSGAPQTVFVFAQAFLATTTIGDYSLNYTVTP